MFWNYTLYKLMVIINKNWYLLTLIIIYTCTEPIIRPDEDCKGIIGGSAVQDDCDYCTGGTSGFPFNYLLGCDSSCQGTQIDCDSVCGGPARLDCNNSCGGTSYIDYVC